jgi:hypothetical protein
VEGGVDSGGGMNRMRRVPFGFDAIISTDGVSNHDHVMGSTRTQSSILLMESSSSAFKKSGKLVKANANPNQNFD